MKIKLTYQGRSNKNIFSEAEELYLKRLKKYISFEIQAIVPLKLSKSLSVNEIRSKEEDYFKSKLTKNNMLILLDEKGRKYNSIDFAKFLERIISLQNKDIDFVVVGAFGFSDSFKTSADHVLALSDLTYSHHLARIVFLEQLYRGFSIIKGEPYHNI